MKVISTVQIPDLLDGDLMTEAHAELEKVFDNCLDDETSLKSKRKFAILFEFVPSKDRGYITAIVKVESSVNPHLCSRQPLFVSSISTDENGEVFARITEQKIHQGNIFDYTTKEK